MSWPFRRREAPGMTADDLIGERTSLRGPGGRTIRRQDALRHSAVWACLRLRADLVSTMPVDVYRNALGVQFEVPPSPVLVTPDGKCDVTEWMYSTQFDLDSTGNTFGIIRARDGLGFPAVIELVPVTDVVVQVRKGVVSYRIANEDYSERDIWHEKQFTMSGLPVGLSPVAHAAAAIRGYLSAQDFAQSWYGSGGVPSAHLKNTARVLDETQSQKMKARFKASMSNGDVFVSGKDWDYNMIAAKASESQFLESQQFSVSDVCRFLGVPGDLVDAEAQSSAKITYANITQRHLQLLILHLGPSITRREKALSTLTPKPRYVKLNTAALLKMDLKSRYDSYKIGIDGRFLTVDEARELEDLPPLTAEQIDQMKVLFQIKAATPATTPTGVPS